MVNVYAIQNRALAEEICRVHSMYRYMNEFNELYGQRIINGIKYAHDVYEDFPKFFREKCKSILKNGNAELLAEIDREYANAFFTMYGDSRSGDPFTSAANYLSVEKNDARSVLFDNLDVSNKILDARNSGKTIIFIDQEVNDGNVNEFLI